MQLIVWGLAPNPNPLGWTVVKKTMTLRTKHNPIPNISLVLTGDVGVMEIRGTVLVPEVLDSTVSASDLRNPLCNPLMFSSDACHLSLPCRIFLAEATVACMVFIKRCQTLAYSLLGFLRRLPAEVGDSLRISETHIGLGTGLSTELALIYLSSFAGKLFSALNTTHQNLKIWSSHMNQRIGLCLPSQV